jgi:hypothetical protein
MTYCNLHQPDFLTGSSDNTCGAATINSSHVASYEQCQGGGFSCQKFQGAWQKSFVYVCEYFRSSWRLQLLHADGLRWRAAPSVGCAADLRQQSAAGGK